MDPLGGKSFGVARSPSDFGAADPRANNAIAAGAPFAPNQQAEFASSSSSASSVSVSPPPPSSASSTSSSSSTPTLSGQQDASELAPGELLRCLASLLRDERTRQWASELLGATARPHGNQTASSANASGAGGYKRNQQMVANVLADYAEWEYTYDTTDRNESDFGELNSVLTSERYDLRALAYRLPAIEQPGVELEALSESWQQFLVVVYSLTAISSFILNVITVIVLSRCRRSELRKYLINLSMSDLLLSLLSIPFTYTEYMLGHWVFATFLCPVVRFVVTLSVFVSVATMVVIGINRHMAIMYPLKRKKYTRFRRWTITKTHVIGAVWLLGLAISTPEFLMYSSQPFCYNKRLYYECHNDWPASTAKKYAVFIYVATFLIPLSLLSYLYTSMGFKIWRRKCPGNVDATRDLTMQTRRVKCIKMLLVVVVLFAVFWLPLQTYSMVVFIFPDIRFGIEYESREYSLMVGAYFAAHWLGMAHSCLNPLVYCFMNDQFRSDLKALICGLAPGAGGSGGAGARRSARQTNCAAIAHCRALKTPKTSAEAATPTSGANQQQRAHRQGALAAASAPSQNAGADDELPPACNGAELAGASAEQARRATPPLTEEKEQQQQHEADKLLKLQNFAPPRPSGSSGIGSIERQDSLGCYKPSERARAKEQRQADEQNVTMV